MRAVVRDNWLSFTEPFEGGVACAYADIRGKVTIAYGNLVDTPGDVAALPLVHKDGTPATNAEKIALWNMLHDDPKAAEYGWRYAATLSPLRLTREAMGGLALARLESNDRILAGRLRTWHDLSACAQMAMHSLAWACGANAQFPKLFSAVDAGDYSAAAVHIHINEWTPEGLHNKGLIPRNVANKILMRNAQRVRDFHLDPDTLEWTTDLDMTDEPTSPGIENPASEPTIAPEPIVHARMFDDEWTRPIAVDDDDGEPD